MGKMRGETSLISLPSSPVYCVSRAAPAGLKGAVDHIAVARRRRGGEHKWIWHFYSEEIGAKILSHGSILQISLSVATGKT